MPLLKLSLVYNIQLCSVEEVLGAQDKELNAWVSLRKTCQYRPEEEERKDFHVYRNKVRLQFLLQVLKLLFSVQRLQVEEKVDALAV